jgi:hypothetical protein
LRRHGRILQRHPVLAALGIEPGDQVGERDAGQAQLRKFARHGQRLRRQAAGAQAGGERLARHRRDRRDRLARQRSGLAAQRLQLRRLLPQVGQRALQPRAPFHGRRHQQGVQQRQQHHGPAAGEELAFLVGARVPGRAGAAP